MTRRNPFLFLNSVTCKVPPCGGDRVPETLIFPLLVTLAFTVVVVAPFTMGKGPRWTVVVQLPALSLVLRWYQ